MLAHTASIRGFASAHSELAASLSAAAARLASVPAPGATTTFGPVAAGFLAALAAAVEDAGRDVAALGGHVTAAGATAGAAALQYEAAERRSSVRLQVPGV